MTGEARPPVVVIAGRPYPMTLTTGQAALFLGCSTQRLQAERGTGRLPVEPLELGRWLRWPTLTVARAVGLDAEVIHVEPVGGIEPPPQPL